MDKREIKFRALNAQGELIHGLPYTDSANETRYYNEFSNRLCWRDTAGAHCNQPYKNGTLMQYTGLKDRNGVEIYESDICECRMVGIDTHIEIVNAKVSHFHAQSAFAFEVIGDDSDYRVFAFSDRNILSVEVIGNAYQNRDLLETIKEHEK